MRSTTLRASLAVASCLLASLAVVPASQAAAPCTKYASPTGSDAASGTESSPLATVQKLSDSLQPGDVGCLRSGTYVEDLKVSVGGTSAAPVTIRSYPGERATVQGRMWIARGADNVTISNLNIDGKNTARLPSPTVNASDTTFDNVDVTNEHTEICFILGSSNWGRAIRTIIENSRIHDCGKLPSGNQDHGIYMAAATDAIIRNNVIYNNVDRGIQLYPDAQHATVTGNIIDGNGEGVIFSGDGGTASSNNIVSGNIISNSNIRNNVESWYPDGSPAGSGNSFTNNCVFSGHPDGGIAAGDGFSATNNVIADPQFVDRANGDYRLRTGSPCAAVLNGALAPAVAAGTPDPGAVPAVTSQTSTAVAPATAVIARTTSTTASGASAQQSTTPARTSRASGKHHATTRKVPVARIAIHHRHGLCAVTAHHHSHHRHLSRHMSSRGCTVLTVRTAAKRSHR